MRNISPLVAIRYHKLNTFNTQHMLYYTSVHSLFPLMLVCIGMPVGLITPDDGRRNSKDMER